MARPKPKIPRLTYGPPSNFKLNPGQWNQLERALGSPLDPQARQEIIAVTKSFSRLAEAESNTGLMADAVSRTKQFKKSASTLIEMKDDALVPISTRGYVDDQIALSGGRKDAKAFYDELEWFVKACDAALSEMTDISQHRFWPDGFAWQNWIRDLTRIVEAHQLPATVRKDSDKSKTGKASPFAVFVEQFQTYIPATHRRATQSIEALSGAINIARSKPKSPVNRVR